MDCSKNGSWISPFKKFQLSDYVRDAVHVAFCGHIIIVKVLPFLTAYKHVNMLVSAFKIFCIFGFILIFVSNFIILFIQEDIYFLEGREIT